MQNSKRKIGKTIFLLGTFAVGVLFLSYFLVWNSYKHRFFDNVLMDAQDLTEYPAQHGITMYEFPIDSDDPNTAPQYSIMMYYPTFLKYNGSYDVSQNVFVDAEGNNVGECQCSLRVRPSLFHESEYEWWIADLSQTDQMNYHFMTLKSMEVLENYTANDTQTAISKYNEHIQAMLKLIDQYFTIH